MTPRRLILRAGLIAAGVAALEPARLLAQVPGEIAAPEAVPNPGPKSFGDGCRAIFPPPTTPASSRKATPATSSAATSWARRASTIWPEQRRGWLRCPIVWVSSVAEP